MVDHVYRNDLPRLRQELVELRSEFARDDRTSAWVRLRIEPLLRHLQRLEALVPELDVHGLRGGVPMLHSDLVYLRGNVQRLRSVLTTKRTDAPTRRARS